MMDDKKGLVIDPYCGSGTTLVAAKLLGHDYLGIEIAKEYTNYATNRINNFEYERRAVNAELEKHMVTKTFKDRKENGEFTGKYKTGDNKIDKEPQILKLFEKQEDFNATG